MKVFLKDNWFKIVIILIFIGIAWVISYYFLSYIPERDRNKQIDVKIAADQEKFDKEQKEKRDYIAKRKKDCFDIYDKEKKNWSNTRGLDYSEDDDTCYILYTAGPEEWAGVKCVELSPTFGTNTPPVGSTLWRYEMNNLTDCLAKQFRKEF